jgi:hypothetical protein
MRLNNWPRLESDPVTSGLVASPSRTEPTARYEKLIEVLVPGGKAESDSHVRSLAQTVERISLVNCRRHATCDPSLAGSNETV